MNAVGQGPYGLTTPDTAGDGATVSGTFIVGPGSCFSLTDHGSQGAPQALVFPEGAEFAARDDQPSVTTDDLGTVRVGEAIEVSAVEVAVNDVTGIPEDCTHAADSVLVVQ